MTEEKKQKPRAFSFGEPERVLDRRSVLDYGYAYWNGEYYEPPVDHSGLAKTLHATSYHESAIDLKAQIFASCCETTDELEHDQLENILKDFFVFGNGYVEKRQNGFGETIKLLHSPAMYTRRRKHVHDFLMLKNDGKHHKFKRGRILHIKRYDVNQEIMGICSYMGALNAIWLNEEATLFRRRYYLNGAHMGFIFYLTSSEVEDDDIDEIEEALTEAKGVGNFKNLFIHAPGSDKEGAKIMPVGELATKDDFWQVKQSTRDDIFGTHRIDPKLMGVIPTNTTGLGNPNDAAKVLARNEIVPLQFKIDAINKFAGKKIITFKPYQIEEQDNSNEA